MKIILAISFSLISMNANAQTIPRAIFTASATADWITTYKGSAVLKENNPLINWAQNKPILMVSIGVGLDIGAAYGLHRVLHNHKRIESLILLASSAYRFHLAYSNYQQKKAIDKYNSVMLHF